MAGLGDDAAGMSNCDSVENEIFGLPTFLGCRFGRGPHGSLLPDLGRTLVFPQALERRVTNASVRSPFGERNFTQQGWINPMNCPPFTRAKSDGLCAA